jgi:hypothetical protein
VVYHLKASGTLKFQEVDGSQTKEFKIDTKNYTTDYQELLTGT